MNENLGKAVRKERLVPENLDSSTVLDPGEKLLSAIENIDRRLDEDVAKRFGAGFYDKACTRINDWCEQFFQKGEDMVNWAEVRGLQLPKSKVGMRVLSGVTGVTGTFVPGLGVLLPLSIILWKRGDYKKNTSDADTRTEI